MDKYYYNNIKNIKLLSEEETNKLFIEYNNGNIESRNKLIEHNLRLVLKIANSYSSKSVPFTDLFQAGTLGLIKAIEKYDINKDNRFSTYAYYWIKRYILEELRENVIRLPENVKNDINKYKKVVSKLEKENGVATIDDIIKQMNISYDTFIKLYNYNKPILSLNESVKNSQSEGEEKELLYFIEDNCDLISDVLNKMINEDLLKVIESDLLTNQESTVLKKLYGINCNKETLKDIGNDLHVSKQRINQIEAKALNKLRNNELIKKLR